MSSVSFLKLLLAGLIILAPGLAQAQSRPANGRAAISWTLFDDRLDFQLAPSRIRSVGDASSHQSWIDLKTGEDFNRGFEAALRDSLAAIGSHPAPKLTLYINSHGGPGVICRQNGCDIPMQRFLKSLNDALTIRPGLSSKLEVQIACSACYSGSFRQEVELWLAQNARNSGLKVSLITSTSAATVSLGNELLDRMEVAGRIRSSAAADGLLADPFNDTGRLVNLLYTEIVPYKNEQVDPPKFWSNSPDHARPLSPRELAAVAGAPIPERVSWRVFSALEKLPPSDWKSLATDHSQLVREGSEIMRAITGDPTLPAGSVRRLLKRGALGAFAGLKLAESRRVFAPEIAEIELKAQYDLDAPPGTAKQIKQRTVAALMSAETEDPAVVDRLISFYRSDARSSLEEDRRSAKYIFAHLLEPVSPSVHTLRQLLEPGNFKQLRDLAHELHHRPEAWQALRTATDRALRDPATGVMMLHVLTDPFAGEPSADELRGLALEELKRRPSPELSSALVSHAEATLKERIPVIQHQLERLPKMAAAAGIRNAALEDAIARLRAYSAGPAPLQGESEQVAECGILNAARRALQWRPKSRSNRDQVTF